MMHAPKSRRNFSDTDEGKDVLLALQLMEADEKYATTSSYTPDAARYPNNVMTFVDRNMHYLTMHPALDSSNFLSNLRLKTLIR